MAFDVYRILTPAEAQELVNIAETMEWEIGQARTKEATGTIKKNFEIKETTSPEARSLLDGVRQKMMKSPILSDSFVKKIFSLKFNKYTDEGEYQRHGDAPIMGGKVRTDLACTLFLSHRDTYEGGELCVEDAAGGFNKMKGDPGLAVVYPCHMPHWVTPVTSGSRISIITWFESMYRDENQRDIMRRYVRALREMEKDPTLAYGNLFTTFGTIQSKLVRMWADYE